MSAAAATIPGAVRGAGNAAAAERAVMAALATVRDPELDEDLVSLRFVAGVSVDEDGRADVRLRLPTYFCAPNFAFLMAADAQAAVGAVAGVHSARVVLEDHFASEEITDGLAGGLGFDDAFDGDADGAGLGELRALFNRKAFLARQQRVCDALLAAGHEPHELGRMTLADLPRSEEVGHYRARRAELGLPCDADAPFVMTASGDPVGPGRITAHLRIGRSVRVSLDGNAGFCRGLLQTRYPDDLDAREEPPR